MSGWLYIIKNGDLYKIGITRYFEKRMSQLKPDYVVIKLYSRDFKQLEREFHKRYKNVRIPQTEYFRLDNIQIKEIKQRISSFYYPRSITFIIFIKLISLLLVCFIILLLFLSLTINDFNEVLFRSLLLMERISYGMAFFSLFIRSKKYFSLLNELKFRLSKLFILFMFGFLFRIVSALYISK